MKNFISLNDTRIRLTTIKKYKPLGEDKIVIYYGTSRFKLESEIFTYPDKYERNNMLNILDAKV